MPDLVIDRWAARNSGLNRGRSDCYSQRETCLSALPSTRLAVSGFDFSVDCAALGEDDKNLSDC